MSRIRDRRVTYDSEKHHRRSIRLKGYDYAQAGAYFVTIVAREWACLFGEVAEGQVRVSEHGVIVQDAWNGLPTHHPSVELDAFVVMPNHVQGIIVLRDADAGGAGFKPAPTGSVPRLSIDERATPIQIPPMVSVLGQTTPARRHGLPEIVRAFKTFSARRINAARGTTGEAVWQRNYYEHIIRNDVSLNRIREYIIDNPLRWESDRENPSIRGSDAGPDVGAGLKPIESN
jgi:putative transposase